MLVKKFYSKLQVRYPRSKGKFVFANPSDLRRKTGKIFIHYLIFDPDSGYVAWKFSFRRKKYMNRKGWADFIKTKGHDIFITSVLPAFNEARGHSYSFDSLLAWGFSNDIPTRKDSKASGKNKSKRTRKE